MITGKAREQKDYRLQVGLGVYNVIAVNPNAEEYKEVLGIELDADSNLLEYIGESRDGNKTVRIDFWGEEIKSKRKQKVSFFLEDKYRVSKDGTKTQFINSVGSTTWADDEENLPKWFKQREYRKAKVGEEELYNFIRTWLGKLDTRSEETVLYLDWKKLMKGNVSELREQINGEFSVPFIWLNEIKTVTKENDNGETEVREYQVVYNKAFLPQYCMKNFRLVDYTKPEEINKIRAKQTKNLAMHERFILEVTGEYGSRNFFLLKELCDYDPSMNIVSTNKVIEDDDSSY